MHVDTLTLLFLGVILGVLVWHVHAFNTRAHLRSQEILRDIARFLGTDRR